MSSPPCSPILPLLSSPPSFLFEDSSPSPPPPPSSSRPVNQPILCTPPPLSAQSRRIINSTAEKLARAISRNDSTHKRNLLNELCQQVATTPLSAASPKQRVLNSAEWNNMVTRLYSHKEQRDGRVLESADKLKLREQAPCTFTPKLNERSVRLASMSGGDIASRSLDHQAKREAKLNEERLLLQQVQDRELTFHPMVNSANSVRARVMTDNPVQRKLDYAKQVERRREQDFLDTHTFSPSLNARSMEMTQNRAHNGGEATPTKPPIKPYDSPSFHPQINSYSRKLVHSRANNNLPAFERLYELSVASRRARGLGE
ncbi:hypothetical protein BASA81_006444 [Batrachochytrium salamandrivorans]|nr:hypothetical protein BASA81_006444 [Batrachochytrium salamandrivorans]